MREVAERFRRVTGGAENTGRCWEERGGTKIREEDGGWRRGEGGVGNRRPCLLAVNAVPVQTGKDEEGEVVVDGERYNPHTHTCGPTWS